MLFAHMRKFIAACYLLGAWGIRRASRHHKGSSTERGTDPLLNMHVFFWLSKEGGQG